MFSPVTRWLIAASLLLIAMVLIAFVRAQNRKSKIGGRISRPKQLWLGYAVYLWFVLCPILAFEPNFDAALRTILGCFAINMWLRRLLELYMLYVSKNWKPPIGIAHDLMSIALVLGLAFYFYQGLHEPWGIAFLLNLLASLSLETFYAVAFRDAARGKTTGDDAVWFASKEDPEFARINRITMIANVPLYGFLLVFLLRGVLF